MMRLDPATKKTRPDLDNYRRKYPGCNDYPPNIEVRIRMLWDIDLDTGTIYSRAGKVIKGSEDCHGHLWVSLRLGGTKRVKIRISRLVWRIVHGYWPPFPLKHIDCDITNNSIHNLDRAEDGYQQRKYLTRRPSRAA